MHNIPTLGRKKNPHIKCKISKKELKEMDRKKYLLKNSEFYSILNFK